MSKRLLCIAFTIFLISSAFPSSVFCAGNDWEILTLKGMKTITALVAVTISDYKDESTLEDSLQTVVELKLRLAGIEIVKEDNNAILMLTILGLQTDKPPNPYFAFKVDLTINQVGILTRDPDILSSLVTWSAGGLHTNFEGNEVSSKLRSRIERYMDTFLNDYLKANPK